MFYYHTQSQSRDSETVDFRTGIHQVRNTRLDPLTDPLPLQHFVVSDGLGGFCFGVTLIYEANQKRTLYAICGQVHSLPPTNSVHVFPRPDFPPPQEEENDLD